MSTSTPHLSPVVIGNALWRKGVIMEVWGRSTRNYTSERITKDTTINLPKSPAVTYSPITADKPSLPFFPLCCHSTVSKQCCWCCWWQKRQAAGKIFEKRSMNKTRQKTTYQKMLNQTRHPVSASAPHLPSIIISNAFWRKGAVVEVWGRRATNYTQKWMTKHTTINLPKSPAIVRSPIAADQQCIITLLAVVHWSITSHPCWLKELGAD